MLFVGGDICLPLLFVASVMEWRRHGFTRWGTTQDLNPFGISYIFFPFLITLAETMLYGWARIPWGVILNSLGLQARSFGNVVTIVVSRVRNGHIFTLWTRSQVNVSSWLTSRDLPPQETHVTSYSLHLFLLSPCWILMEVLWVTQGHWVMEV